jgi:predicted aspartyl protease
MLISTDYPYLEVEVTIRGFRTRLRALLDTGFDGSLVIPEAVGPQLGKPDMFIRTRLADGIERRFPAYQGGVELVGLGVVYLTRLTFLGDECLMGQGII